MSGLNFDFGELNALAVDLGEVPLDVIPNVRKAVEHSAFQVKKDWAAGAKRTGLKRYAASIDYELELNTDGVVAAEIGPNLGRTGGSFGFVEDAPGGVKSAPQHAGRNAAKAVEADFVEGILKATEGL